MLIAAHVLQAWRTEAWALVQVAPSVAMRQGHGQEMGMFGLPLPRAGPFIIGSAADQVLDALAQASKLHAVHFLL